MANNTNSVNGGALHMELIDEWDPCGAFEEEAVFTIANCMWKKRRIREKRQLEVLAHLRTPDPQSSKEPTPFFESALGFPLLDQLLWRASNSALFSLGKNAALENAPCFSALGGR